MPDAIATLPAAPSPSPNAAPARPAAAPSPAKTSAVRTPAVRTPATAPSKQSGSTSKPSAEPAKVVNPFDQASADMERFSDPDQEDATDKPAKLEAEVEEAAKPDKEAKPEEKLGKDEKPVAPEKPGKTSPWKLVESYKQTNTRLQQEIAELRSAQKPGELPKEHQERVASIEARNKELEDEIRHVNYSKSKEFQEKYQQPYEEAWTNAIADLKELVITNEDGSSRGATAQDLIALSNMPLGQARATAKAWFGDSADDVMSHRRTIRDLSDKQTKALDESKRFGGERDQQRTAEMQAKHKARSEETAKVWNAINEETVAKYEYLRPVEGETERNEKLEKAKAFVDETLKRSINSAKTQQERDEILRSHSAVRNRAIGFSTLKHENKALKSELETLKKALEEFQHSEPTNGEPRHEGNGEGGGDAMQSALNSMTRYVT